MFIREANLADARQIAEIHVASWRAAYRGIMPDGVLDGLSVEKREKRWAATLSEHIEHMLVAEEGGQLCGWASFGPCRDADATDAVELFGIYLDPTQRRRGIGRLLWANMIEQSANQGHYRLAVWVLEANLAARQFYEAMGGKLDAGSKKMFERPGMQVPEIRYWCPIQLNSL